MATKSETKGGAGGAMLTAPEGYSPSAGRYYAESVSRKFDTLLPTASVVRLRLAVEGDELVLAVEDDGVGFDPAARKHNRHGLAGMAHRVQMLAGRLEIDSAPGKGTRITARVPFARMH